MNKLFSKCLGIIQWTIGLTLSAALVACGSGGGSSPPPAATTQVANANVVAPATASTVAALVPAAGAAPIVATFASGFTGVDAAGAPVTIAGATTVAFTTPTGAATPTFSVNNGGNTASGDTVFGSCSFRVVTSTFPPASPFGIGKVFKVDPCTLTADTSGALANGTANTRNVTLDLGNARSTAIPLPVTISSTGTVTIGSISLGTVPVTVVTGAGG